MSFQRLFLLVEGDDDREFLQATVVPRLEHRYGSVTLWPYSKQKM